MRRIALTVRPMAFVLGAMALILGSSASSSADPELPAVDGVSIGLNNAACVPGECICAGSFEPATWLQWHGPRPAELAGGVPCIVADFDGNGVDDFALPGGEGLATVVMMAKAGLRQAVLLDAGGVLVLYTPRKSAGPNGEPVSRRPGLLVRNVGRNHAVFLWRDGGFARILYPAT